MYLARVLKKINQSSSGGRRGEDLKYLSRRVDLEIEQGRWIMFLW